MRIAISPDEDPGDTGSVAADGTPERDVNLGVCNALVAALHRCGQDVWFDPSITYVQRVQKANADGSDILVACAHNSSTPGASGTQFVKCSQGVGLQDQAADAVYAELAKIPSWPMRRADAVEGVYECCQFLGDTIYIEFLFMSPDDQVIWAQQDYAILAAEATARGLANTYGFTYVPTHPGVIDMRLALVTSDRPTGAGADPHGNGAVYLALVNDTPQGIVPWTKRYIVAPGDLGVYGSRLSIEKVDPFLLDRAEDGPPIHTGTYSAEP